jgi:NADH-quinone oxidoreductase subunit A
MTELVYYLLVFVGLGAFFLFIHLMMGRVIRPIRPAPEKLTIYECGEPTIGSAWIQFDLRYYVVALLFVIFDVEVAFFFPWAVVFGTANGVAGAEPSTLAEQRAYVRSVERLNPDTYHKSDDASRKSEEAVKSKEVVSLRETLARREQLEEELQTAKSEGDSARADKIGAEIQTVNEQFQKQVEAGRPTAQTLSMISLVDILVFFGILLVGFAYLWKRGDIDWVRSTTAERLPDEAPPPPLPAQELVGSGAK